MQLPRLGRLITALVLPLAMGAVTAAEVRVAVITDGAPDRQVLSAAAVEREIANVASPDTVILLPADKRFAGDWSLAGAGAALDRALADRDVDVVLTLGILASQQAARRAVLPKPVIAPLVIDPVLQDYPLVEGRSGRRNFTYVADFQSIANEVQTFHDIVGFRHLVALVDDGMLAALPQIQTKASELAQALSVRISLVRAAGNAGAALAAI